MLTTKRGQGFEENKLVSNSEAFQGDWVIHQSRCNRPTEKHLERREDPSEVST